jgi:hypothetical protein
MPRGQGAAAQAAAELQEEAREEADARTRSKADKDIQTILQLIPKLKDVEYHIWARAVKKTGFRFRWPAYICDLSLDIPDLDQNTEKDDCDQSNAYLAITTQCQGHDIEEAMEEEIQLGDARGAFKKVHDHFYRPTEAGKQTGYKNLFTNKMENTDTNLAQFVALVSRNAKVVENLNGETISEGTIKSLILAGLLVEFDPIKPIIEQTDGNTLQKTKDKLEDFAVSKGFTKLTKGGNDDKRNKTYTVQERKHAKITKDRTTYNGKPWLGGKGDCQLFLQTGNCRFGQHCKFLHPSKVTNPVESPSSGNSETQVNLVGTKVKDVHPNKPHCLYCGENTHFMAKCPLNMDSAESRFSQQANYSFMGATEDDEDSEDCEVPLSLPSISKLLMVVMTTVFFCTVSERISRHRQLVPWVTKNNNVVYCPFDCYYSAESTSKRRGK